MNFCRRCGSKLTPENARTFICENGHIIFMNGSVGVGIFIVTPGNKVLLARRAREPHIGLLDSIGGFVDGGEESLDAAAERELKEELDINPSDYKPLTYLANSPGIYPYKGEDLHYVGVYFWTELASEIVPKALDDVAELVEVPIAEIDMSQFHEEGIRVGARALQRLFAKEQA